MCPDIQQQTWTDWFCNALILSRVLTRTSYLLYKASWCVQQTLIPNKWVLKRVHILCSENSRQKVLPSPNAKPFVPIFRKRRLAQIQVLIACTLPLRCSEQHTIDIYKYFSQNYKKIEVGRGLWKSSSPAHLLTAALTTAQGHNQLVLYLQERRLHNLSGPPEHLHQKTLFFVWLFCSSSQY